MTQTELQRRRELERLSKPELITKVIDAERALAEERAGRGRRPVSERARRVGQVAWDAVHNHGEHRRQAPNDDYLTAVGDAVLGAIENEGERA